MLRGGFCVSSYLVVYTVVSEPHSLFPEVMHITVRYALRTATTLRSCTEGQLEQLLVIHKRTVGHGRC